MAPNLQGRVSRLFLTTVGRARPALSRERRLRRTRPYQATSWART